jgi:hypothetical protein
MKRYLTAVIAALIIIGLVVAGFQILGEVFANTTGVSYSTHGIRGNSGATSCSLGDLLDTDTYITGWNGVADSEKVVVQGAFQLYSDVPGSVEVKRTWYKVTLDGRGDNVKINGQEGITYTTNKTAAPAQDVYPDKWYFMPSFTFKITNPFVGKVTVQFWADRQWNFGLNGGAAMLASDEAYLKSGIGRIHLTTDVFEEGTNAVFNVETGYASSSKDVPATAEGWMFSIYNPEGTEVFAKPISDNFNGQVKWLIPTGSYKAEWSNRFLSVLRNVLIDQDQRPTFVVGPGMLLKKPNLPTATLIRGEEPFQKGELVTIRLSAEQNPIGYPIAGFTVSIVATSAAGAVTDYVMKDQFITSQRGNGTTYFCDVTFAFPESGYAELWGNTVDTKNLNSGNTVLKFTITGMGPPPGGDDNDEIPMGAVLAIILAVMALIAAMVLLIFRPLPFALWIGLALIVAAVIGIWYAATVML